MRSAACPRIRNEFEAFQIGRAARLWYESTGRDGQFGRAGRHSRTIGPEGFPGETGQGNPPDRYLRNSLLGGPSRVVTYETQDNHSFSYDRPDAGWFPACSGAKPLYRANHRRPVVRPESLQSPWLPGPRIVGWPNQ